MKSKIIKNAVCKKFIGLHINMKLNINKFFSGKVLDKIPQIYNNKQYCVNKNEIFSKRFCNFILILSLLLEEFNKTVYTYFVHNKMVFQTDI